MSGSGQTGGRAGTRAPTRRLTGWSPADLRLWPGRTAAALHVGLAPATEAEAFDAELAAGTVRSDHWDGLLAYVTINRSWIDGVVVDGPDPTSDPDLTSLLAALADNGIPARLVAGGMDPGVLSHAVAEQLVASVSLEVPAVDERLAALVGVDDAPKRLAASVEVLVRSGMDHDFHTTADPNVVTIEELPTLAARLRGGRLYALEPLPRRGARNHDELVELRAAARACCASLPTIVREGR